MGSRGKKSPRSMQTWFLTVKNLKTMFRDRSQLAWLIGYPLLLIIVFSVAFGAGGGRSTFDVAIINHDIVGLEDPQNSWYGNASLIVVDVFNTTLKDTVDLHSDVTYEQAVDMAEREELDAIVVIDELFSESIVGSTWWYKTLKSLPHGTPLDQVFNGSVLGLAEELKDTDFPTTGPKITITTSPDPITGSVIPGIVGQIVNAIQLGYNDVPTPDITVSQVKIVEQLTGYDYLAPGFVVVGTLVVISQLAIHFAEEKEMGTLRRLDTTPVSRRSILFGGMMAQLVVAAVQIVLLLVLIWVFGAYFHPNANLFFLFLIPFLFAFTSLGFGLLIASFVKSTQSAGGLSWFLILPLQFLGGAFFYYGEDATANILPSSYAIHAMRQLMVFGNASWGAIGIDILGIIGWGVGTTLLGVVLFQRKTAIL